MREWKQHLDRTRMARVVSKPGGRRQATTRETTDGSLTEI